MSLIKKNNQRISFNLNTNAVVADVATALICNLARVGVSYTYAQQLTLINGVGVYFYNVTNDKSMTGKVNIAIAQIASLLFPNTRVINEAETCDVRYIMQPVGASKNIFPVDFTDDRSLAEFFRANGIIGGILVEHSDIKGFGRGVMVKGRFFDFGEGLGPVGVKVNFNGFHGIQHFSSHRKGLRWVDYLTWRDGPLVESAYLDLCTINTNYPFLAISDPTYTDDAVYNNPGRIILTYSLLNPDILNCDRFRFPAYNLPTYSSFLSADAAARGLSTTDYDMAALAAYTLASIAIHSGDTQFLTAFFACTAPILPQAIVEAAHGRESIRNGLARLPYVLTGYLNDDPTASNRLNFLSVGQIATDVPLLYMPGISKYHLDQSSIEQIVLNLVITAIPSGFNYGGSAVTTTAHTFSPSNFFSMTVSKGPLSNPGQDIAVGKYNPSDTTLSYAFTLTSTSVTVLSITAVNSYSPAINVLETAQFVGKLPLPYDGVRLVTGAGFYLAGDWAIARAIKDDGSPAATLAFSTVSEATAKNNSYMEFFVQMNKHGGGSDSVLTSALRLAGTGLKYAGELTGFGLAGKAIEVVAHKTADYYDGNTSQKKSIRKDSASNKPRARQQKRKPLVRKPLKNLNNGGSAPRAVASVRRQKK